jgi:hypothetical protein
VAKLEERSVTEVVGETQDVRLTQAGTL